MQINHHEQQSNFQTLNSNNQLYNQNQLDLNEERQIYQQLYQQISPLNIQSNIKYKNQSYQSYQTGDQESVQVIQRLLATKYSKFNQRILMQKLYERCCRKTFEKKHDKIQNEQVNFSNFKDSSQPIESINQRKDFDYIKKLNKTVEVFVEYGYGIAIARIHLGQSIQSNPYNSMIFKIIKETWKAIELEILKIRRSTKKLSIEEFNQIKTPLVNAKNWMEREYLLAFHQIILYVHGLTSQKPSQENYEKIYDYLNLQTISKKISLDKKELKKKKSKDKQEDDSEEFKIPKYYQKNLVYGKPRIMIKKGFDE